MSLSTKIERFGQAASTVLFLKSDTRNKDYAAKVTGPDERGDNAAQDLAGLRDSPTATYGVKASGNVDLTFGTVNTVAAAKYCLNGLEISTKAATPPEVTLSGEQLQDDATASSTIPVGAIAVSVRHKAQILDGAFTLEGDGCKLIECSLSCKANITRATKDAETIAHDISGARKLVKATVKQYGATAPTVTPAGGYAFLSPDTDDNPDEDHTVHTFELYKDVASVEPA